VLAPDKNPVPVTVTAKVDEEPIATLEGLIEVMVGTGFGATIVNGSELDGPAFGGGLATFTCTVPGFAYAAGKIVACKAV
jgi:hypothetical protein